MRLGVWFPSRSIPKRERGSSSSTRSKALDIFYQDRTDVHRGDIAGALNAILSEPPYGEGVDEAKASCRVPLHVGPS
jgi:hypothetical protein